MTLSTAYPNGIPVVNVEPLYRRENQASMEGVLQQIRAASRENGLFYLSGHGIPSALLREVYLCSQHFFGFPEEFKSGLSTIQGGAGYIAEKHYVFGRSRTTMEEDIFPFRENRFFREGQCKCQTAADRATAHFANCAPTRLIELYYREVFALCRALLEGCAIAQSAPADVFRCLYEHPILHVPLLQRERSASLSASSDPTIPEPYGEMIILWRDVPQGVRLRDSMAGTAASTPDGSRFVLRIADIMARWSSDLHITVPHQVIDADGAHRYWIPVFYIEESDTPVECRHGCTLSDQGRQLSLVA